MRRFLLLLVTALLAGTATACGESVAPMPGRITGTITLAPTFLSGIENSRVAIFTSQENLNMRRPALDVGVTGSFPSYSFVMENVRPGRYYLQACDRLGCITYADADAELRQVVVEPGETVDLRIDVGFPATGSGSN